MRDALAVIIAATLLAAPAEAASWQDQPTEVRPGAFLGARVKLPLGGHTTTKARAELAFAPTQSRISNSGLVRTRIGEGFAFGLTPHSKPTLTVGGTRADVALGFAGAGRAKNDQKMGISTGGWVAIGVGTVLIVGAVGLALWADHVSDCDSRENGC